MLLYAIDDEQNMLYLLLSKTGSSNSSSGGMVLPMSSGYSTPSIS